MSTPNARAARLTEAASQTATAESLGWQLRAALPPLRLHSVSLCDSEGEVVWLSEGALGPDEHGFVIQAIGALGEDTSLPHCEADLEDGRFGAFLPVRAPQGELVGVVMILADSKGIGGGLGARVLTPAVRAILQRMAILLRPHGSPVAPVSAAPQIAEPPRNTPPPVIPTVSAAIPTAASALPPQLTAADVIEPDFSDSIADTVETPRPAADTGSTTAILSPLSVDEILSFELVDEDTSSSPAAPELPETQATARAPTAPDAPFPPAARPSSAPPVAQPAVDFSEDHVPVLSDFMDEPLVVRPFTREAHGASDTGNRLPADDAVPTLAQAPAADQPLEHAAAVTSAPPYAPVHQPAPTAARAFDRSMQTEPAPAAAVPDRPARKEFAPTTARPLALDPPPALVEPAPAAPARSSAALRTISSGAGALTDPAFNDLMLSVQLLSKLRPGGRTKRYEVLVRTRHDPTAIDAAESIIRSLDASSDLDGFVISQLFTWLAEHPEVREREPHTFSINLSARALHDERLPELVASWLRKTGVPAESIGFELAESLCIEHKAQAERFVAACEKLGCFLVIDDFTLDSRALDFLRTKALRLLKLHPRLTKDAMKDKLSQALVIAISQSAKVLGVHCAAKKIESQMVRRWITAIGFDFAQGTLFEGPQPLDALCVISSE